MKQKIVNIILMIIIIIFSIIFISVLIKGFQSYEELSNLQEERVKVCEANNGEFYMYVDEPRCLIQDVSFEIVKVNDKWRLIVA